jgi:hypothetical protein
MRTPYGGESMKSKLLIGTLVTALSGALFVYSGVLTAGSSETKSSCSYAAGETAAGKAGCSKEMCAQIKQHRASMQTSVAEMGEHLTYMERVRSEEEWMEEMKEHLVMLQGVLEEMSNCPMDGVMHSMMHGDAHPAGTGSNGK